MEFFLKEHSYFHPSLFSRDIYEKVHKNRNSPSKYRKNLIQLCDPLSIPILIFYLFSFSFSGWTLGEGIVVHDQNDDNVDVEKMTMVEGMIKSDLTGGSTAQAHKN